MAKYRVRRWLQFGVLDLLVLTTIVAVVVVLWQPPRMAAYYEPLAEGTRPGQQWAGNGLRMKFRWCPSGDFKMGEDNVDVKLTRGFWLGRYEVTQGEYCQVMNGDPSAFPGGGPANFLASEIDLDRLPVENVSWQNAVEFCRRLTQEERKAGRLPPGWEYRLPTEAQWEYACRAGTHTRFSFGDDEARAADYGWHTDDGHGTHQVGQKLPNAWGLHDMHGNVCEWCSDWYQSRLPGGTDPEVNEQATIRVDRGASWLYVPSCFRSGRRSGRAPSIQASDVGFRVALVWSR